MKRQLLKHSLSLSPHDLRLFTHCAQYNLNNEGRSQWNLLQSRMNLSPHSYDRSHSVWLSHEKYEIAAAWKRQQWSSSMFTCTNFQRNISTMWMSKWAVVDAIRINFSHSLTLSMHFSIARAKDSAYQSLLIRWREIFSRNHWLMMVIAVHLVRGGFQAKNSHKLLICIIFMHHTIIIDAVQCSSSLHCTPLSIRPFSWN